MSQKMNKHLKACWESSTWRADVHNFSFVKSWIEDDTQLYSALIIMSGHLQNNASIREKFSQTKYEVDLREAGFLPISKDVGKLMKQFSRIGEYHSEKNDKEKRKLLRSSTEEYSFLKLLVNSLPELEKKTTTTVTPRVAQKPLVAQVHEISAPQAMVEEEVSPQTPVIQLTLEKAILIEGKICDLTEQTVALKESLAKNAQDFDDKLRKLQMQNSILQKQTEQLSSAQKQSKDELSLTKTENKKEVNELLAEIDELQSTLQGVRSELAAAHTTKEKLERRLVPVTVPIDDLFS